MFTPSISPIVSEGLPSPAISAELYFMYDAPKENAKAPDQKAVADKESEKSAYTTESNF